MKEKQASSPEKGITLPPSKGHWQIDFFHLILFSVFDSKALNGGCGFAMIELSCGEWRPRHWPFDHNLLDILVVVIVIGGVGVV